MIKLKILTLLLLITGFLSLSAQNKVFFYVTDKAKEPLDLVGMTIIDMNDEEFMNETVMYFPNSIELPKKGTYLVTCTKYGYLQKTDTIVITEPEQVFTLVLQKVVADVVVGSIKAAPKNLQAGSIYVIDRDYIDATGARDIMDLLMTVPGFSFGVDVLGNINNTTRGVWTNEGKFMVMVDGIMMNELAYGTMQWGQRFPIANIERIEILRGPASLFNGGLASYGVLNIILRKHTEAEGIAVSSIIGKSDNNIMRQGYSAIYNKKLSDVSYINASGYISRGQRSDKIYTDFDGKSYSMNGNSDILNEQLMVQAGYKSLKIQGFYDNYRYYQGDAYGSNSTRAYPIRFPVAGIQASADISLGNKWTLTPFFGYLTQKPYSEKEVIMDSADLATIGRSNMYDFTTINRLTNSFTLSYKTNNKFEFDIKGELHNDIFRNNEELFPNKLNTFRMQSQSIIANARLNLLNPSKLNKGDAFYIQTAVRYEKQTYYSATVPMGAVNILIHKFHAKFLYGRSFRAPLLENIRLNIENSGGKFTLKPEYTNTWEAELGLDFSKKSSMVLNFYHNNTSGTISYYSDPLGNENYINGGKIGTSGFDFQSKFFIGIGNLYLNAGWYHTNTNDSQFRVPNSRVNIGIPNTKINAILSFDLIKKMGIVRSNLSFTYTYLSKMSYYKDANKNFAILPNKNYFNATLSFNNISQKGLKLSFSVFDILNQGLFFAQPYNGSHAIMPGTGREFVIKIAIDIQNLKT